MNWGKGLNSKGGLKASPFRVDGGQISSKGLKGSKKPLKKGKLRSKPKPFDKELYEADKAFYEQIWREREHRCQLCGKYLGEELAPIYMHHLLEKAEHKALRHVGWNIIIVCIEDHQLIHNGFPHEKYKAFLEEVKSRE